MKNIIDKIKQNGGFVNAHSHIDRANTSYYFSKDDQYLFLKEKWKLVDKIKNESSTNDYKERMLRCIQDQQKFGVTALLSFIDIDDVAGFRAIDAATEAKGEAQIDFKVACQTLKGVLDKKYEAMIIYQMPNIDIIGSLPSADADSSLHLDKVMFWAKKYNKRLHVHVDQLNTPEEKETELWSGELKIK